MPTTRPRSVWGKAQTTIKAWAVVDGKGKIVLNEKGMGMLVYDKKWRAGGMLWKPSERVVQVAISYSSEAKDR